MNQSVEALIARSDLPPDLKEQVRGFLLPAIRLRTRVGSGAQLPVGSSKIGGLPDLAPAVVWPQGETGPLTLLAQVRLGDLGGLKAARELPAQGLLSFFYPGIRPLFASEDEPPVWAGCVLFERGDPARLLRRRPYRDGEGNPLPACHLSFEDECSLPNEPDPWYKLLGLTWVPFPWRYPSQPTEAYHRLLDQIEGLYGELEPLHRLLGYADGMVRWGAVASRMQVQCQQAFASSQWTHTLDWRLLLQVDLDDPALQWTERAESGGRAYFWIMQGDLEGQRYDRVILVRRED